MNVPANTTLTMRSAVIAGLCALLIALNACAKPYSGKKQNTAINGVLDLRGWDFIKDGPVNCRGMWHFSWRQLLPPDGASRKAENEPPALIELPGAWNGRPVNGRELPGEGYATYGLRVLLDKGAASRMLALKIPDIFTASRVFVDGHELLSRGVPGTGPESSVPGVKPGIAQFKPSGPELDIAIQVSNFHHNTGGIPELIVLGTAESILHAREFNVAFELFLFGSIIVMSLYHFFIFSLRPSDRSSLFFALSCLCLAVFDLVNGEIFLMSLFPGASWGFRAMAVVTSFYLSVVFFMRFTHSLFPDIIPNWLVRSIDISGSAFTVIALATPARISSMTAPYFQVITLAAIIIVLALLFRALAARREGVPLYLLGMLVMFAAALNDILHDNGIIYTGYIVPFGLFIFIVLQSFLLSIRFTRSFFAVEKLTAELGDLNRALAQRVEERTEELQATLDELESMNDSLVSTNRSLEEARRVAVNDIEMAVSVQTSVLQKDAPASGEWDVAYAFKPMAGVSGDFYDFYQFDGRLKGIGLFDVSGHGVSSALVTMLAKSIIFRIFSKNPSAGLGEVFTRFDRELFSEIGKSSYYLSGVLVRFGEDTIDYVNAGHHDIYVKSAAGARPVLDDRGESITGFFLGLMREDHRYDQLSFPVKPGEYIVMFTDGLTEARNDIDELYGAERAQRALDGAPAGDAWEVLDYLLADLSSFVKNRDRLNDDMTIIIARRR